MLCVSHHCAVPLQLYALAQDSLGCYAFFMPFLPVAWFPKDTVPWRSVIILTLESHQGTSSSCRPSGSEDNAAPGHGSLSPLGPVLCLSGLLPTNRSTCPLTRHVHVHIPLQVLGWHLLSLDQGTRDGNTDLHRQGDNRTLSLKQDGLPQFLYLHFHSIS